MVTPLSPSDRDRLLRAVEEAESQSSGTLFCVVARRVSRHRDVGLAWAAAAALTLPLLLVPLGFEAAWLPGFADGWQAAQLAATPVTVAQAIAACVLVQTAVFLLVFGLHNLAWPRRMLTPVTVRRHRVRRAALNQFLAHHGHAARLGPVVLIFCALEERRVEVIAGHGGPGTPEPQAWGDLAAALTQELRAGRLVEGLEDAIGLGGRIIAAHWPHARDMDKEANASRAPCNRLVEL